MNCKTEAPAKKQTMTTEQILGLVDDFKAFVFDSLQEGYHEDFEDIFEFLDLALATYSDKMSENYP